MAMKLYSDTDIQAIANAIRAKNGSSDTYKVSEMATAIGSISGGVNSAEGYIELSDTSVNSVEIPVDLRNASYFLINLYVVETGEVSGGVVTKYTNIEIPTAFSSTSLNFVWNYMLKYPQNPAPVVYRDSTNLSSITRCNNASYVYARRGSNGAVIGLDVNPTISASGCTLVTQNGARYFCLAGAYAKFKYEVYWW